MLHVIDTNIFVCVLFIETDSMDTPTPSVSIQCRGLFHEAGQGSLCNQRLLIKVLYIMDKK